MFPIGSKMVHPPEKLSNDHAHDAQACGPANQTPQVFEYISQLVTFGQIESTADILVKRFAQPSAFQSAIASTSAVLQSADEMEMTELHYRALALAESDNAGNLVGNRSSDPFVYRGGNGCECVRPALHILSARAQHRIEKNSAVVMARLYGHLIKDPILSSKPKVKSVQHQNQRSSRHAQRPSLRNELSQRAAQTPTQALRGKSVAWRERLQRAPIEQDCFQNSGPQTWRFSAASLLANCPRTLALTALTTSRAEVINFRSATTGVRMPRFHARELHINYASKCLETQVNFA